MPLKPIRVLIVDNDESMLAAIRTRLDAVGCPCVTARTGAQGLSLFKDSVFDLIISDINMPSGDGVSLAKAVRAQCDTPMVLMTGFLDRYRDQIDEIGSCEVIEKPFSSESLWIAIQRVVNAGNDAGSPMPGVLVEIRD